MKATIKFRPLEWETLALLHSVNNAENGDPVATFSRLLSAALISAAILGITREQMMQQCEACIELAIKAVAERTDIFGGMT